MRQRAAPPTSERAKARTAPLNRTHVERSRRVFGPTCMTRYLALPAHSQQVSLLRPGRVQRTPKGMEECRADAVRQVHVGGRDHQLVAGVANLHQPLEGVPGLLLRLQVVQEREKLGAVCPGEFPAQRDLARRIAVADAPACGARVALGAAPPHGLRPAPSALAELRSAIGADALVRELRLDLPDLVTVGVALALVARRLQAPAAAARSLLLRLSAPHALLFAGAGSLDQPSRSPRRKSTKASAPSANIVSPGTRIHFRSENTWRVSNSGLRAYQ